ncbi:putative autotransporter adhesin-like protein [Sphingomonas sp. F9_3S_D5_B_2]
MRSTLPMFALAFAISAPALAAEAVPVGHFSSVQLRGGGDLTIVPGPVQRVTILNGSTQFTTFRMRRDGQLEIDACNRQCPHNYNLRIQIESPRVPTVAVEAGGTIIAGRGFAPQREIVAAVSAGGTIDLRALDAEKAVAAVNAGGDIYVRPRASLTAAVSSGGDIHYSGNPAVTMAVQGGGDVRRD